MLDSQGFIDLCVLDVFSVLVKNLHQVFDDFEDVVGVFEATDNEFPSAVDEDGILSELFVVGFDYEVLEVEFLDVHMDGVVTVQHVVRV